MGTTVALILFVLSFKISIILAQTPCVPSHDMSNGHYTCAANGTKICDPGYLGADCKNRDPCGPPLPCLNGATCETIVSQSPPFTCHCPPNFSGRRCEIPIQTTSPANTITTTVDGCAPRPCKNGGTCTSEANGGFSCACPPTFRGFICHNAIIVFPPLAPTTSSPSTFNSTTTLPPTTNAQPRSASPTSPNPITTPTLNPIITRTPNPLPRAVTAGTSEKNSTGTAKVMSSFEDDTWLIVGGSIGSFLLFALLVFLVVFLCSRDKKRKNNKVEQATHPRPTWKNRDKVLHYI